MELNVARTFSPDVETVFADSAPIPGKYEVLISCYMSSKNGVVVHLNKVRGLPANKMIYLKTKYFPDPHKHSKKVGTLVQTTNESLKYGVHRMVSDGYLRAAHTYFLFYC